MHTIECWGSPEQCEWIDMLHLDKARAQSGWTTCSVLGMRPTLTSVPSQDLVSPIAAITKMLEWSVKVGVCSVAI